MGLQDAKYLVAQQDAVSQPTGNSKFLATMRKIIADVQKLSADVEASASQKNDTANLKNSYKQFVEDYNQNAGLLNARLNAVEELLKKVVSKLDELENI